MRGFSTAAAAEPLRKASGRGAGALSTFKEANNILDRWRNGPRQQRDGAYRQGPRRGANAGGGDFNNDWANDDEGNGNNNKSDTNIESPINIEKIPLLRYFKERNKPNKNTNKL